MRLLVYTMLFPHAARPHYGVFVKERLARFRERHGAEIEVVAPTPLVPPFGPSRWDQYRGIPRREDVDGFAVEHPRFLSPPGFGDRWRAQLMAMGTRSALLAAARRFRPDVVDVHYAYPDGAAAARLRPALDAALGRRVPMVLTVRGTDLNLLPELPRVRTQIASALGAMDHVICVADALRDVALELGMPAERVTTLRNGVDVRRFTPDDRAGARARVRARGGAFARLPERGPVIVCVGHLIQRKGQHGLVDAYARVFGDADPAPVLLFVGEGEERVALEQRVARRQLGHRVVFAGAVDPRELPDVYRASDVMVLASLREGWPNVVLEALACGTPVVATRVWGTPEILEGCPAGLLVDAGAEGLSDGLGRLQELDPAAARGWAERHTWDDTLDGMARVFEQVAS